MNKVRRAFYKNIKWLELAIAVFLSAALLITGIQIALYYFRNLGQISARMGFDELLADIFTLIIGAEFIKMILKPTSGNVLEVILFTIARFLVLDHSSMMTCLLGVLALGVLFAIRKFLYCEIDGDCEMLENVSLTKKQENI